MRNESGQLFDALELRKLTLDCLDISSVKKMARRLDRLVNADGEEPYSSLSTTNTNRRRVCRNIFVQGSLVWSCRNCQSDHTSVQCSSCFQRSNHKGHEVFFHQSSTGGCCDCGDLEAWAKEGSCPDHVPLGHEEDIDIDPVSLLPPTLAKRARIVICEVLRYVNSVAWDCSINYETAPENLRSMNTTVGHGSRKRRIGVEVDQSPHERGTEEPAPLPSPDASDHICVRVHNDDIHTYNEVTQALTQCQCDSPSTLTEQVDKKGEALVASHDVNMCSGVCRTLRSVGLLVSTCRADHIERENRASAALDWIMQLSKAQEGLSRLVTLELLRVRTCSSVTSVKSSSVLGIREAGLSLDQISSDRNLFADISNTSLIVLLAADPLLSKGLRAAAHELYMHLLPDLVFKAEFALGLSLLYLHLTHLFCRGIGTSADGIFIFTTQIFTTPSLVKTLSDKNAETSSPLVILRDTKSIAPGPVMKHMWYEGGGLIAILFSSLKMTIQKATFETTIGGLSGKIHDPDKFLNSRIMTFKRFSHAFKSCEYVLRMRSASLDMLSGKRTCGHGVLLCWINLLSELQTMDTITRLTSYYASPDEHNSKRWLSAFTLSLNIGSLNEVMLQSLDPKKGDGEGNEWENTARDEAMLRTLRETASALQLWLEWNCIGRAQYLKKNNTLDRGSLHIPLHRFLSSALAILCSSDYYLSKYHWFDLKVWGIPPRSIMEHPLNALVLSTQIVSVRLWVRNGPSATSCALNYTSTPVCKWTRDFDILLLQATLTSSCISHAEYLVVLFEKFNVCTFLYPYNTDLYDGFATTPFPQEAYMRLAEGVLTLILQIVTEIPPLPTEENKWLYVARELSHHIAAGCKMYSSLMSATCPMLDVTEKEVIEILNDISDIALGPKGVRQYNLSKESANMYDPTFWHLSLTEHQVAEENVVEALAEELQYCDEYGRPLVGPPLPAHPMFSYTRSLLDSYILSTVCNRILLTYVLLSNLFKQKHSATEKHRSINASLGTFTTDVEDIHSGFNPILHASMQMSASEAEEAGASSNPHKLYFGNVIPDSNIMPSVLLISRVVHILTLQLHCCTSLPLNFKDSVSLLRLVSELKPSVGALYSSGMKWVISEYERRVHKSPTGSTDGTIGHELHHSDGVENGTAAFIGDAATSSCRTTVEAGGSSTSHTPVLNTDYGPMASRKRAMAFMAKQQASFSKFIAKDDEEEESIVPTSRLTAESKEHSPRCIMCHECSVVGDSLAFVGLAQRSTLLSRGIASNDRNNLLRRQYIVYASEGCQVRLEFNLDSQKLVVLPKGIVATAAVPGIWDGSVYLGSPLKGWATVSGCLAPLQTYAWSLWGRPRPHVSLCGHAIHLKCWDAYFASIVQQYESGAINNEQMPVTISRSEYLCPMCKRISNILIPCIDQSSSEYTEHKKCKASNNLSLNEGALNWSFAGNRADDGDAISSLYTAESMEKEEQHEDRKDYHNPALPYELIIDGTMADKTVATSILRHALLEGACKKSKCPYSAFRRCAEGLFTASTPPWASKEEVMNSNSIVGPSLDHLMLLWCSLGYTLASAESIVRTDLCQPPVDVPDIRVLARFVREAFTCCMNLQATKVFVNGVVDLLEGRNFDEYPLVGPATPNVGDGCEVYFLPKPFVWEIDPVKTGTAAYNALPFSQPGFRGRRRRGIDVPDCYGSGFYCCERGTSNVVKFVPPPLLSWDLLCLSSCVGSIAGVSAIRIMCVARLAQVLIEPCMCQWGNVVVASKSDQNKGNEDEGDEEEDVKVEVKALSYLRSELAESAGLDVHPRAPTGASLSDSVRKAIIPFYRTVVLLTETLSDRSISSSMCPLSANDCLHSLGLPDLENLASDPRCISLSKKWGQQYRCAHVCSMQTNIIDMGLAAIPFEALQPLPGNGSTYLFIRGPPLDVGREEEIASRGDAYGRQYGSSDDEEAEALEIKDLSRTNGLVRHSERFWELIHNLGIGSAELSSPTTMEEELPVSEDNTADGDEENPHVQRNSVQSAASSAEGVDREGGTSGGMRTYDTGTIRENPRDGIAENHRGIGRQHNLHGLCKGSSSSSSVTMRSQPMQDPPILSHLTGGVKLCTLESSQFTSACGSTNPMPMLRLCDLSHLGVGSSDRPSLIGLPLSYVELFLMIKPLNDRNPLSTNEIAVCLICGEMLPAGSSNGFAIGQCTKHTRYCGSGCGVYFLVQRCIVLLMRDSYAAYFGSVYIDEHGEEDIGVKRGRPLYLSLSRYSALRRIYQAHQVAEEVCRRRSLANTVIANAYF